MPFYEYQPKAECGCSHCHAGFVVLQNINEHPLTHCPHCQALLRRVISAPNLQSKGTPGLTPASIEQAGFTQYKKVGQGVYEKTAGRGPAMLHSTDQ